MLGDVVGEYLEEELDREAADRAEGVRLGWFLDAAVNEWEVRLFFREPVSDSTASVTVMSVTWYMYNIGRHTVSE